MRQSGLAVAAKLSVHLRVGDGLGGLEHEGQTRVFGQIWRQLAIEEIQSRFVDLQMLVDAAVR